MITLVTDWLPRLSSGFPPACTVVSPGFTCTKQQCPQEALSHRALHRADDGATPAYREPHWILYRLAGDRTAVPTIATAVGVVWELVNQVGGDTCCWLVSDKFPPLSLDSGLWCG
ncbi:hypothetical protein [Corynebacterium auriscanis]|uniref:hypothetical protein n=1 Tax=Corynebacterium auriscanis TaxID=99807 RepID=UPI0024AE04AB|nr:hypothetical protein [Corynebacterium auriscanis]